MIHIMIAATCRQKTLIYYALKNCTTNPTDTKHTCHCIPYTVWLTQILDWLLSSDSAKSCPAFHADNIGKNEKAATLDSLYSLDAKKKPHCFPVAVLLTLPCCVHSIGICSLFTALMTGFKHAFLKSALSASEIFSTCNSFPRVLSLFFSFLRGSCRPKPEANAHWWYTQGKRDMGKQHLLGRKIILKDDGITGAAFPSQGQKAPLSTAGREPVSLTTAEIASA